MLQLINKELFAFKHTDIWNGYQLEICSANELLRYRENHVDSNSDIQVLNMEHFSPIRRHIMNIRSFDTEFFHHPMSMRVSEEEVGPTKKKNPTVDVRCLRDDLPNRINLYVVAFPFNGRLVPIPEDPKYRIYKGTLVSSNRNFWFNQKKYRKTLYLIIEPNLNLFKPEHKYHTDKIEIKFEAMGIFHDINDDQKEKTIHETMTLTITDGNGAFTVDTDREILDHRVELEALTSGDLWKTFHFEPKVDDNGNTAKPQKAASTGYFDGTPPPGYKVTTNRHGIRKEVPVRRNNGRRDDFRNHGDRKRNYDSQNNYRDNRNYNNRKSDTNIDQMIKDAELVTPREYSKKKNRKERR